MAQSEQDCQIDTAWNDVERFKLQSYDVLSLFLKTKEHEYVIQSQRSPDPVARSTSIMNAFLCLASREGTVGS